MQGQRGFILGRGCSIQISVLLKEVVRLCIGLRGSDDGRDSSRRREASAAAKHGDLDFVATPPAGIRSWTRSRTKGKRGCKGTKECLRCSSPPGAGVVMKRRVSLPIDRYTLVVDNDELIEHKYLLKKDNFQGFQTCKVQLPENVPKE